MKYTIEQRIQDKEYDKIINFKNYDTEILYNDNTGEYFYNVDEMEEHYKLNNLEMPQYAYGCEFMPVKIDIDWILEYACEEHAEGTIDRLKNIGELVEAIKEFNKANKKVGSYYEDLRTIIELI